MPTDEDCTVKELILGVENVVTTTDLYKPLTGVFSTEETIQGWQWDRRTVEDWNLKRTRYDTFLGGHSVGLLDGTKLTDWQSGSLSGLKYCDTAHYRVGDGLSWTPRVTIGSYALYFDERNLYSDYSYSQNFDLNQNESGFSVMQLRADALFETIQVAIWDRTDSFLHFKARSFEYADTFTGELNGGMRLETEDIDGNFLPMNFASRKREFTIRNQKLYLNGSHQIDVGVTDPPLQLSNTPTCILRDLWENKGSGSAKGRDLFANYFPIQKRSVRVVTENNDIATEWEEVETLSFSGPTDLHFVVDYDLGIITIGGFQADNLVLREDLEAEDIEVLVYPDKDVMKQYPDMGILTIGNEQLLYLGKTKDRFIEIVRGHNGTIPATHSKGAIIQDTQHGAGTIDNFYISYTAVPRVDYEVTAHDKRSANINSWLDVRPVRNADTNNVLQIQSSILHLDSIVLETDSPLIGGNLYGPVFYGTDVSRLTARGLDSQGNPVEGIPLTIQIVDGTGTLNGAGSIYTTISNTLGEIYSFYNSPYSNNRIELTVKDVQHIGTSTVMTVPELETGVSVEDVWVYQVLKHDKAIGTIGLEREVIDIVTLTPPFGNQGLTINGLLDEEDYKGGFLYLEGSDGVRYFRNIIDVRTVEDISMRPVSRLGLDVAVPSGVAAGQPVWLFEDQATEWNPALLNGARVILYEFNNEVEHPVTGLVGAFAPLHPDSVTSTTLTFDDRLLPLPDPTDYQNNLGAYSVIAPSEISVQAYATDPASGRVIQSNIVRLALRLPAFLTGVDTTGVLPIPYGWTLVTEEFNIGAGLGGANFLTINPSGTNQFSIAGLL